MLDFGTTEVELITFPRRGSFVQPRKLVTPPLVHLFTYLEPPALEARIGYSQVGIRLCDRCPEGPSHLILWHDIC